MHMYTVNFIDFESHFRMVGILFFIGRNEFSDVIIDCKDKLYFYIYIVHICFFVIFVLVCIFSKSIWYSQQSLCYVIYLD